VAYSDRHLRRAHVIVSKSIVPLAKVLGNASRLDPDVVKRERFLNGGASVIEPLFSLWMSRPE